LRYDRAVTNWTNLPLRVFFKFVIIFLATLVTIAAGAIFHVQSNGWIAGTIFLATTFGLLIVFERSFPTVYGGSGWHSHPSQMKQMFNAAGDVALDVDDVAATQRWYSDKLGLHYSSNPVEEAGMGVGYSPDAIVIYLSKATGSRRSDTRQERPPIMFSRRLNNAHEFLSSRNVEVGPIQKDSGGNRFFRFRDLEGNELEVCQDL